MAFEDRSSPNTAASPSSETTLNSMNSPNSPESSRTSPYTCTTIPHINESTRSFTPSSSLSSLTSISQKSVTPKPDPERSFLRITSYALSSPPYDYNRTSPKTETNTESLLKNKRHNSPNSPKSPNDNNLKSSTDKVEKMEEEPTIQHLKYSIRNILQPDFGKNALQKTKSTTKISFKPYENTPALTSKTSNIAPLGSLCQTVSQIGKTNIQESPPIRPKSPTTKPCLSSPEEANKTEENKLPTLWPAWVYCTRYSDRPSSGKQTSS